MKPFSLALALVAMFGARSASAEVEVSALFGQHFFSSRNPLGRPTPLSPPTAMTSSGVLGARFTYFPVTLVGGELEVAVSPSETVEGVGIVVPSARASAVVNLLTGRLRPFVLAGGAAMVASPSNPVAYSNDLRGAAMAGAGLRFDIGDWWGARADGRAFALKGDGGTALAIDGEWSISIYGRFPAPPPPEERDRGPLIADEDHDGVGDKLDKCLGVPGPVRNYGCPIDSDRDHDGVADRDDRCPDGAGPKERGGCPDTDGDGLSDAEDRCPAEAGPRENQGCADRDGDGDGIVDRLDKCPKEPETVNGIDDQDGCPDATPAPPPPPIRNLEAIDFTRGADALTPASFAVLDAAAKVLLEHPEVNVAIVGHTDATGNEPNNQRLSRARAESVRQYLIKQGVPEARLSAIGKGSSEPITGPTPEETNRRSRRVEFRFSPAGPAPAP